MKTPTAKNWDSLLDFDEIDVESRYMSALCTLASFQMHDKITIAEEKGENTADLPRPDLSDVEELIQKVDAKTPPDWWPRRLERVEISVKSNPDDGAAETHGPHPLDPANGSDMGARSFRSILLSLLDNIGPSFSGSIAITIKRMRTRKVLKTWRGRVAVGEEAAAKKGKKKRGSEEIDELEERIEKLTEREDKKDTLVMQMFQQSSHVIHASAAALNATRGVNMAPPGEAEGGEGVPLWARLGMEAIKIGLPAVAGAAMGGDTSPHQMASQMLTSRVPGPGSPYPQPQHHMHPQYPALPMHGNPHIAADPAGPPADIFDIPEGEYEGMPIQNDMVMGDEEFRGDDEFPAPMDDFDEMYDEDEEDESDYYTQENEEDENPLEGLSDDQVATHVEQWMDRHQNPAKLKVIGMRLAKKIMS